MALSARGVPGRGWTGVMGAISSVVAGLLVLVYPAISLLTLVIVLSVWLLVLGVMEITLAFPARSAGHRVEDRQLDPVEEAAMPVMGFTKFEAPPGRGRRQRRPGRCQALPRLRRRCHLRPADHRPGHGEGECARRDRACGTCRSPRACRRARMRSSDSRRRSSSGPFWSR